MNDPGEQELQRLRRCLRDVVALSALPSVWTGYDASQISAQLGEVVGRTLDAEAVYVRAGRNESTWMPGGASADIDAALRELAAQPLRADARIDGIAVLSNALSFDGADRVVVASRRDTFPDENDRLLLRVAANQASTWIQRKNAERALSEETAFRRGIENSMAAGVASVDVTGRQTYVNRALAAMVGWDASELVGATPPFVYWAPEDYGRTQEALQQVMSGRLPPGGFDLRFRRKNEERFDAQVLVSPLEQSGTTAGYLACVYDVTERRAQQRAASFLSEASEVLSRSLDYEQTLKSISELAVPRLADWCFVDVVESGGSFRRIAIAHADPADAALAKRFMRSYGPIGNVAGISETLAEGRTVVMNEVTDDLVNTIARDDDHREALLALAARCYVSVPLTSRGTTFGVITFIGTESKQQFEPRDVALLEELARRAAVAADNSRLYTQAQEANRAKDEFLANVSHELRTPMTAIMGWAHLLQVSDLNQADVRVGIETIRQSAQAQAKLIDDLLDVSRIVSGKLNLSVRPVDVAGIARQAAATIRTAAAAKRQQLNLDVREMPAIVIGDGERLQQVFWNLLSNAVKFTPPGGSIGMTVAKSGDSIVVRVSDSGDGIPAEFLPLVFDRFRQLGKAQQSRSGLGIGLAIAKELVEMHGGSIRAESGGERRGSTFTVVLPAAPAAITADPVEEERDHLRLRGVRVLLAEDDEMTRTMLTTVLRTFGGNVCAASSAAEALSAVDAFAPDVIVTDIAMPQEDGITLLRRLRSERRITVPAIAVTAYADDTSRRRVLAAGFHAFVSKPVDPADFALTVERVLRGETIYAPR